MCDLTCLLCNPDMWSSVFAFNVNVFHLFLAIPLASWLKTCFSHKLHALTCFTLPQSQLLTSLRIIACDLQGCCIDICLLDLLFLVFFFLKISLLCNGLGRTNVLKSSWWHPVICGLPSLQFWFCVGNFCLFNFFLCFMLQLYGFYFSFVFCVFLSYFVIIHFQETM